MEYNNKFNVNILFPSVLCVWGKNLRLIISEISSGLLKPSRDAIYEKLTKNVILLELWKIIFGFFDWTKLEASIMVLSDGPRGTG